MTSPSLLGPITNSSLPESVLMDWWLPDLPSARLLVAGRHRVQAISASLPGPLWDTLCIQQPGVRDTGAAGEDLHVLT